MRFRLLFFVDRSLHLCYLFLQALNLLILLTVLPLASRDRHVVSSTGGNNGSDGSVIVRHVDCLVNEGLVLSCQVSYHNLSQRVHLAEIL